MSGDGPGFSYWDRRTSSAHKAALDIALELGEILALTDLAKALDRGDNLAAAGLVQDRLRHVCTFLGVSPSGFATPRSIPGDLMFEISQEAKAVTQVVDTQAVADPQQSASPRQSADATKANQNDDAGDYVPLSMLVDASDPRLGSLNAVIRFIDRAEGRIKTRPGKTKDGKDHPQRRSADSHQFRAEVRRQDQAAQQELDRIDRRTQVERLAKDQRRPPLGK